MPIALFVALAGSLVVHAAALFGPDVDLAEPVEPTTLQAELRPPPAPAAVQQAPVQRPPRAQRRAAAPARPAHVPGLAVASAEPEAMVGDSTEEEIPAQAEVLAEVTPPPAPIAVQPVLAASGFIRYAVYKVSLGMQVGVAEQRWKFSEDGSYELHSVTETTGLAAVLRPARIEQESRGRLVAGGLQPSHFHTLKNGQETSEVADFDWAAGTVRLARDGSTPGVVAGTQDLLSLNFQLAYLPNLAHGQSIGVVTGKKYERYALDALGEEILTTPAGTFRTLHLRSQTDTVTEFWVALDRDRLPVKIRFTDKKGDAFEQIATEIGK